MAQLTVPLFIYETNQKNITFGIPIIMERKCAVAGPVERIRKKKS